MSVYPVGGEDHSDTYLEAAIAAAEFAKGDVSGPHESMFHQRMADSVQVDKKRYGTDRGVSRLSELDIGMGPR
jgi:hypothetical protein